MLSPTLVRCSACVAWYPLKGEEPHGKCKACADWKMTVASHGCHRGQPRLACPPSERLENETEDCDA